MATFLILSYLSYFNSLGIVVNSIYLRHKANKTPPNPQVPKEFENEIEAAKFIEIDFLNKDNVRFPDALEDFKEIFNKVE